MSKSNHIPIKVTIELKNGEAIIADNPTDGILAKLYFDKLKSENKFNGDYKQPLWFLTETDGVYHTSNPIYKTNMLHNDFITKTFDTELFSFIGDNPMQQSIYEKKSGRYKAWVVNFEIIETEQIVFYLHGDFDYIVTLLKGLRYIGKKASIGFGKVKKILVEEIKEDHSLMRNGEAMRFLPYLPKYKKLKYEKIALKPIKHPYWGRFANNKQKCFIPERKIL